MLFWHLGGTIGAVRHAFRDERMDLRLLMLGAILADLIDTPVGLLGWATFGNVRLVAHSLLFAAIVMVLVLVFTRRGRPRKRWMPLAIGVLMGLVLDAMWRQPETLWWPFLGWSFAESGFDSAGAYLAWLLTDWRTWALEAVGLVYLVFLARRARLDEPERRTELITTGRLQAPIGR